MPPATNIVPLHPDEEDDSSVPANVLGVLHRKDFELWVCRSPQGVMSLKWWRWRGDLERFFPQGEGELTFQATELEPLADLLISVGNLLKKRGQL